jgi:hypothetical protein
MNPACHSNRVIQTSRASEKSMAHYKRMTILQNLQSIRTLKKFKKLTERYFENVDYGSYGLTAVEKPNAKAIRSQLNLMLERVKRVLSSVEISPEICDASRSTPPEHDEGVYLIDNLFNLHQLKISPQTLLDYVERAIGVYRDDKSKASIRTLNPLFWLSIILDYISSLPLVMLGILGFNRAKIEDSPSGKFLKGCFRAAVLVTVLAIILYHEGYLGPTEQKAQELISHLKLKGQELIAYLQDSSQRITIEE